MFSVIIETHQPQGVIIERINLIDTRERAQRIADGLNKHNIYARVEEPEEICDGCLFEGHKHVIGTVCQKCGH